MAEPGGEKELKAPDALAAAVEPTSEEPHDSDSSIAAALNEKDSDKAGKAGRISSSDDEIENQEPRPDLAATKSYATDASAVSAITTPTAHADKRPWYRNLNPLRWGHAPPVPKERMVSREYNANFISKVTFQWMGPLMSVSRFISHHHHPRY
jgi:ATP-binding cassette subfamily C (CFTR/MRP) protein 1